MSSGGPVAAFTQFDRRAVLGLQLAVLVIAIGLAFLAGGHWEHLATRAMINAIAAVGLALVVARVGLVSLGHAAYFAAGAYATGVLTKDHGWPIPLGIVAALVVGLVFGAIVGRGALRTRGIAFVMVTLAAGEVTRVFGEKQRSITGGDTGLSGIPRITTPTINIATAVILVVVLAATAWLLSTTFGRSVDAARQDDVKAASLGYDVMRSRLVMFTLSAGIVAVAGALLAHQDSFVSPSLARWSMSGHLLVMVLLGGGRTLWGAAVAAVGLTYLEDWVVSHSDHWDFVLGSLFVLVVVGGILSREPSGLRKLFASSTTSGTVSVSGTVAPATTTVPGSAAPAPSGDSTTPAASAVPGSVPRGSESDER